MALIMFDFPLAFAPYMTQDGSILSLLLRIRFSFKVVWLDAIIEYDAVRTVAAEYMIQGIPVRYQKKLAVGALSPDAIFVSELVPRSSALIQDDSFPIMDLGLIWQG